MIFSKLLGKLKIEFIMLLGNEIKSLRDEQGILQRQVATYLEIDRILHAIEGEKELQLYAIKVVKCELTK